MSAMPSGANLPGAGGKAKLASLAVPSSGGKPSAGNPGAIRTEEPTKTQFHTGPRHDACGGGKGGGQGGRKRYR